MSSFIRPGIMNLKLISVVLLCSSATLWSKSPAREEIEAKVVYVDAKNGFVAISKGKADGLGAGFDFEIVRKAGNQTIQVGTGRFDKYLGRDRMSKLIVDDGTVGAMKIEDLVICRRKV